MSQDKIEEFQDWVASRVAPWVSLATEVRRDIAREAARRFAPSPEALAVIEAAKEFARQYDNMTTISGQIGIIRLVDAVRALNDAERPVRYYVEKTPNDGYWDWAVRDREAYCNGLYRCRWRATSETDAQSVALLLNAAEDRESTESGRRGPRGTP